MATIHRWMIAALILALLAIAAPVSVKLNAAAGAAAQPEATITGGDLGILVFRVEPASLATLRIPDPDRAGGALDAVPLVPLGSTQYALRLFFPPDYLTDDMMLDYYPGGALDPPAVTPHPPYLRISIRPSRLTGTSGEVWFVADARQQAALQTIIAEARATEISRTIEQQHAWYPDVLFAESPHFNGGDGRDPVQQDAYRITPSVNGAEGEPFEVTGDDASTLFKRFIDAQNSSVTPVDDVRTQPGERFDVATPHGRPIFSLYVPDPARPGDVAVVPDAARFALRPLANPFTMISSRPLAAPASQQAIPHGDDTPSGGPDAGTLVTVTLVMLPFLGLVGWRVIGWWLDR